MTKRRFTLTTLSLIWAFSFNTTLTDSNANPLVNLSAKLMVKSTLKQGGNQALEQLSREAAEIAVAKSIRRIGKKETKALLQLGGVDLLKAAARSGNEVLAIVHRVPEAARYVIHHSDKALALSKRWGDDAVRLEARTPGTAQKAISHFGENELPLLANSKPGEVIRLLGYAEKSDSPATRQAMLASWKKNGVSFLDALDKHKLLILTGGLTMSMIKVSNGVENGIEQIPQIIPPQATTIFLQTISNGISDGIRYLLILIPLCIAAFALYRHRAKHRPHRSQKK